MRNKFTLLLLTVFLTILVSAAAAQTPSGLEISNPQFVYNVNAKFDVQSANWTSSTRAPISSEIVQEVSALFRNTGTKAVKQISWEFILYKDAALTKIDYLYTFKTKMAIAPGEEMRLRKTGRFWGNSEYLEAKIFRVEYTDGTIWEGARTKN